MSQSSALRELVCDTLSQPFGELPVHYRGTVPYENLPLFSLSSLAALTCLQMVLSLGLINAQISNWTKLPHHPSFLTCQERKRVCSRESFLVGLCVLWSHHMCAHISAHTASLLTKLAGLLSESPQNLSSIGGWFSLTQWPGLSASESPPTTFVEGLPI